MLKKPSDRARQACRIVTAGEADQLASKLADKPYGDEQRTTVVNEKLSRTTISLPTSLLRVCEDLVISNKRNGQRPKSVSALIKAALEKYLNG